MSEIQKELEQLSIEKLQRIHLAEKAMHDFLTAVGADFTDSNLTNTPLRVAKMFVCELLSGEEGNEPPEMVSFPTPGIPYMPIISRNIPIRSLCAHHLMPISGYADICCYYDAANHFNKEIRLPGLSKYSRVVDYYARRFQLQERLGSQILQHLIENTDADIVIVRIKAQHHCVLHRGVTAELSDTVTLHSQVRSPKYGYCEKNEATESLWTPKAVMDYFIKEVTGS